MGVKIYLSYTLQEGTVIFMMRSKITGLISLIIINLIMISLSGCFSEINIAAENSNVKTEAMLNKKYNKDNKTTPADDYKFYEPVRNKQQDIVLKGANDFAFRLSAELAEQADGENFICSPFSVWISLAALVNATDDSNKEALLTALNSKGINEDSINEAAYNMLYDLTKQYDKKTAAEYGDEYYYNPLKIVNAVFVDDNVTLNKSFSQVFNQFFRGKAFNVDFKSQNSVDTVNKWVSDNTDGLITEIIREFSPETIAAIANTIYFSDRWALEFNAYYTKKDTFYSPSKKTTAFFMLREGDNQKYYEDDEIQAMPLEFKKGGGLYILLPKDGDALGLLSSMTSEYFNEIQNNSKYLSGKLLLPKFSIESGVIQLKDSLEAIGVPLFDSHTAPLTGGLLEEDIPVWISEAAHKAVIEVDEKGTTAAAVTIEILCGSALPKPTKPFEMNCNKPFVFILYDNVYDSENHSTNQILFTGIVNKPQ